MRIEKIEPLSEESFVLRFESGESLRCGLKELADFGLRAGLELEREAWERLSDACALWAVRRRAAELLSRRAMSAGELRRKLEEKGADPAHAELAVSRLVELGAIDEAAYAAMAARHYAAKGYGPRRIEQELRRRDIPREYWAAALEALPEPDGALDELVRKKLRTGMGREDLRKLAASLVRRGYGWEEVRAALARQTAHEDNLIDD